MVAQPALDLKAYGAAFAGGGEMGALMQAHAWSTTPVGPIASWPQSLRTALSILLPSGYPMYVAWGPDFTQFYNDAFRPILGSSKHPAALGIGSRETFAEIWDLIGPMFEGVLRNGSTTTQVDALMPLDRHGYVEECYFDFSYSPVRAESGDVGGIFVTCSETTERVLGERRLRTLRDLAATGAEARTADDACTRAAAVLSDNTADVPFALLYLLDEDGRRARLVGSSGLTPDTGACPAVVELAAASASVWPLRDVVANGRVAEVADIARACGELGSGPWPNPARSGLVLPLGQPGLQRPLGLLVAGVSPRRALDDAYRSFFELVASQVSTAVAGARAHEAERRRAEGLAEIDRAKTVFFSNVSHEFRTPLTLLLGPLEETLDDVDQPLLPVHRERLAVAQRNGLRLLKLVNTLLDFARIEAGRIEAAYEPTDVPRLTAELASAFRSAIDRVGLRLIVDCQPLPDGVTVYVDRDMWEKIVLNLVSNAFKFTLEGEIAVSVRVNDARLELAVRDTGSGIPAEEQSRVFDRFHRVRSTRARTFEGSGIGLALVQELVRLHGGEVRVESAVDHGSTFTVVIPIGMAHLPRERIGAPREHGSTATGATPYLEEVLRWVPEGGDLAHGHAGDRADESDVPRTGAARQATLPYVLVADDNSDMREYLRRLLAPAHRVFVAADGTKALEMALAQPPDLVLADVMMPGLDGFGLLQALRDDQRTRSVPIILLSARAGDEAKVQGFEAGADDYLVKPFAARELLARVDAHLSLSAAREEVGRHEQIARERAEAERRRLQEVFMQAPAAICLLEGPEHRFVLANPLYQQLVGRTHDQLVGKRLLDALPEMGGQHFVDLLDRVRATGERFVGSEAVVRLDRRGDGTPDEAYLNFVYEPLRGAGGAVEMIFVHAIEVTDLVRARQLAQAAQQAAQNEADLVDSLYRVSMALSAELDLDTVVQAVTDAATLATGADFGAFFYNVLDERGESYMLFTISGVPREHFSQFPMPRNTAVFAPTFAGTGVVRLDDVTQDARYGHNPPYNGMPIDHLPVRSYLAVPVAGRSGEVLGGLFFGHQQPAMFAERAERLAVGIAAQAAVAIENARLYQQVQRAVQSRDEFLAAAAHDLKTPLASTKGIAQLLKRRVQRLQGGDVQRVTEGLERIDASVDRMTALIDELLDLGRLQLGRALELEREPMDLGTLARQAVADHQPNAPRHAFRISTPVASVVGNWDPVRIRRVLDNLLSNAVKYSPAGGAVGIEVSHEQGGAGAVAVLRVVDHGVGIPAADLPHIFERFRRGANVGLIQGTGIGLGSALMIVEQHGGTISATSSEGSGSTFCVRLPLD